MKIKYLSDLHLEFLSYEKIKYICKKIIENDCDILVLAGDIGYPYCIKYIYFLKLINKYFKCIFLICGNHEYYKSDKINNHTFESIENKIKDLINKNNLINVKFLNNEYYDFLNYRFVGTTLWTKIKNINNIIINDFNNIDNFTIDKYNNLHELSKSYLENIIQNSMEEDKDLIIITHHIPSYRLVNKNDYNNNECFVSECDNLINRKIKLWIYGHSIRSRIDRIEDTIFCTNPIGYENEDLAKYNKIIII